MIHLGLIGYPLSHSLSPKLHRAALQACGLEGDYSLFPIAPDDSQALKNLLTRIRSGEIMGVNVTIPHKQTVLQFMDELTPTAQAIGAVNTIYLRENKLIGDNTDASGFLKDMNYFLANNQSEILNHKSAIVLGAGGSARAVAYALLNDGWQVSIIARRLEQAKQLANSFTKYHLRIANYELSNIDLSSILLIVNTTPIGMSPNIDQTPWLENLPLPRHAVIYDLVYNPSETKLVREAHSQGLFATTGLGMLIEQAALSFELWTGYNPPREIMRLSVK